MLVDVDLLPPSADSPILAVCRIIGAQNESGPREPKKIGTGLWLLGHWNLEAEVDVPLKLIEQWPNLGEKEGLGVCDSPEQAVEYLRPELDNPDRKFFIGFVRMRRADQPREGGWRWHKWGEYIGAQKPRCEYLHDEPLVEEIYTFHVYERIEIEKPREKCC